MKQMLAVSLAMSLGCSSQEEHVLKLASIASIGRGEQLLLARGACIETRNAETNSNSLQLLLARGACIETYPRTRGIRKNLLLLARGACIETYTPLIAFSRASSCSSQEEHVLKRL